MSELAVTESEVMESPAREAFTIEWRRAVALSKSSLVPDQFKDKTENCLIALQLANRINADPMMVMQNVAVIHGKPSLSASFLIACCNMTGRFSPIQYDISGEGDTLACVAWFNCRETGERIEGPEVSMAMAKAEGWLGKSGSKWKTIPTLMIRYRAATFLIRTVCPEIALGFHTQDEVEDIRYVERSQRPAAAGANAALTAAAGRGDMPGIDAPADDEDYTEPERF